MTTIDRRQAVAVIAAAPALWPGDAAAQTTVRPLIGFLNGFSAVSWTQPLAGFHKGLGETGFTEGHNVAIEYRWAEGRYDRLPALAAELVGRAPAVLVATGGSVTAVAAKQATSAIPIVFAMGGDPTRLGLAQSLARPGANATGVYFLTTELEPKRLDLLRQMVPGAALIGVLVNPTLAMAVSQRRDIDEAARALGLSIVVAEARNEAEIEAAFADFAARRTSAALIAADPFFLTRRDLIVALAARQSLPTLYEQREFAYAGGLAAYGTSLVEATRLAGVYVGRILRGERPAEIAIEQSTRIELLVNLKTTRALGLTLPPAILLRADEVIE